uniref:Uncharacterized protein n=1 Tax=Rhizophora mucronata TaxID=61149 RepID=A0A2P2J479_RHIMU
MCTNLHEI